MTEIRDESETKSMSATSMKLSFGEKFGYSLGDLAANFVFQALLALQFDFYTHTYGLTALQAGNLTLFVGLGVAFLNPVMGMIADRTQTRWGKFRPWLLWTALPFGIFCVLTFTTPTLSPFAKIVYAWTTYALLRVIYTINNVPYSSLTAVMTSDPDERTSIAWYRQIAANSAGFLITVFAVRMVGFFGHGNDARGYQLTMGLFSVLSIIFFVIAFFTTKERVQPDPGQKSSLTQDLSDLLKNRPWVILFLATLFYFAALAVRGSVMLPYFRYLAGNANLFSWFSAFGLAFLILGVACSAAVNAHLDKRRLFIGSMVLTGIFSALLFAVPPHSTAIIVTLEALRQFAFGLSGPIIWAMMGDVADYGEWKTGRRASGTVTAAVVFALWVGLALGGAIAGWILNWYGFASEANVQTAHAQTGILLTASIYTALAFFGSAASFLFYPVSREMNQKIADELAERRKGFSSSAS
jgi:sugar (glycoside-pentoside-hexuronide) transporter